MRVIFFGTSSFAVASLKAVANHVQLVVTQPDRPSGRGSALKKSPVRIAAEQIGLEVSTPEKARAVEFVETLESIHPDVLVVASYGQILSERVLGAAIHGGINLHASVLPNYRGAAPIQRAILEGQTETGVTLMQMAKGMDTGDIISIEKTMIGEDETEPELDLRLGELASKVIEEWLPRLCSGDYPKIPQDDSLATYAPKVEKAEAELNWSESDEKAYRRFRAFVGRPGAFIVTRFGRVRLKVARLGMKSGGPSEVLSIGDEGLEVAFSRGSILVKTVLPEGRKEMTGADFAHGHRLLIGDKLGVFD